MRIKDIKPDSWYWIKSKSSQEFGYHDMPSQWAYVEEVEVVICDRYGTPKPEGHTTGQKAIKVEMWEVHNQNGHLLWSRHRLQADTKPQLVRDDSPKYLAANLIGNPDDLGMMMPYDGQPNNQSVEEAILALFYKAIAYKVQSIEAQNAATALKFDVLARMPDDLAKALGLDLSKTNAAEGKHNGWDDGIKLDSKRVGALDIYLTGLGL